MTFKTDEIRFLDGGNIRFRLTFDVTEKEVLIKVQGDVEGLEEIVDDATLLLSLVGTSNDGVSTNVTVDLKTLSVQTENDPAYNIVREILETLDRVVRMNLAGVGVTATAIKEVIINSLKSNMKIE